MSEVSTEDNLWGEIPTDIRIETPVSILRTQAAALAKASNGLLDGRVRRFDSRQTDKIGFELQIVVPSLGNYSKAVVSVLQPTTVYPASVYADLTSEGYEAENPDEVRLYLKEVLQSKEVKAVVKGLIIQARDAGSRESSGI